MENKIKEYVNRKFGVYTNTKKMIELKEMLLSMMLEKYRDCQNLGMTEQKSYAEAITVLHNCSKEQKRCSVKANDAGMNGLGSCRLFEGIV